MTQMMAKYPILAVTGPRQSGKTTLLQTTLNDYRYVTLENPDNREFAERDPKGFMTEYNQKVIFDEVQNIPSLFSYMQGIVDADKKMGQFILSGSQNFNLMERITQSLAGRVALFRLLPFDLTEMKQAKWLASTLNETLTNGFYPAVFERQIDPDRYYANYLDTYVNRDISQLVNIKETRTFKLFVKLCAIRSGQLLNLSDLARDAGVSHTTAKNWISLLETSYIVYLLPSYFKNFGKRLVKAPKLYFYDTGLLCHLLNIRKGDITPLHPHWGHIFETMVVTELIKQAEHRGIARDFYFWRDAKGHEVDVLFKEGDSIHLYEIKASSTIQQRMFDGLDYFEKIADEPIAQKHLIYAGDQSQKRTEYNVVAWRNIDTHAIP